MVVIPVASYALSAGSAPMSEAQGLSPLRMSEAMEEWAKVCSFNFVLKR